MPRCPGKGCGINWKWGWCSDTFRAQNNDGKPCDDYDEVVDGRTWHVYKCNKCGTELLRQEDGGGEEINPKKWKNIEWEQPRNSYNRDYE